MKEAAGRRPLAGVVLVALLAALALASPGPAHAAFPGQNGKIAFDGIRTVYPDGRDLTLVSPFGDDTEPSWSADGSKLVMERFTTDEDPPRGYIMNADGSGVTLLGPGINDPAWSPDGTKVVFRNRGSFPTGIAVINADGTGRTVTVPEGPELRTLNPVWSPDGQRIAYARCVGAPPSLCDIYTMNPDGTAQTQLTDLPGPAGATVPSWSPDGAKIAFVRADFCNLWCRGGIWVMNADGTGLTQVGTGSFPAWSPDGQKIAFGGSPPIGYGIHVMDTDGSDVRFVSDGTGGIDWQACQSPCPSPPPPPYDTPAQANPIVLHLVPDFVQTTSSTQCEARGGLSSSHGAPLSFSSCNPPAYVPGAVARMGSAINAGQNYADLRVQYGAPRAGDQADLTINTQFADIRTAAGVDYDPNPGNDVTMVMRLRISDTHNGVSQSDPATVLDFELEAPGNCTATFQAAFGSSCSIFTSADAVTPDSILEGKDTVIQAFRVRVDDSGANGTRGDADDRSFATQGIYIP